MSVTIGTTIPAVYIQGSTVSSVSTAAYNQAAGNALFVRLKWEGTSNPPTSVTDTAGNTYVARQVTINGTNGAALYECLSCAGHAANVITATWPSAEANWLLLSPIRFTITGALAFVASPATGLSGTGTVASSGAFNAGDMAVAIAGTFGTGAPGLPAAAWTEDASYGAEVGGEALYRIDSPGGTYTVFTDYAVTTGWMLAAASYSNSTDTTAPTLSGATAAATSTTTSSGAVTTNEATGTLYWLTNTSATATAAAVKAGSSQAVTATGVQNTTTSGLAAGTAYYTHFVHTDAAANDSAVATSAQFTTPVPDSTLPTMNGSITVGTKTSSTITISWPAASDNIGVTGYEVSSNGGGSWADVGSVLTIQFTGLTALTAYDLRVRAYDAAGNRAATPLATTTSTYRAGASAGSIRTATGPQDGNPAGLLYAFCELLPISDWVSYTIVSGPTPAGGTLDAQANGAFSYVGPEPATLTIQPEVNGAASGDPIVVTLYDGSAPTGAGSDTAVAASTQAAGAALGGVDTDTAAVTHSQAAVSTAGGGRSETATAADTSAATTTGGRSAADTATTSDVVAAALGAANYSAAANDTTTATDTTEGRLSRMADTQETAGASDTVAATVATTYAANVSETARPADAQAGNSSTPPAYTGGAPARLALRIGLGL